MLRLAPMTALARCVCEIDGMAELLVRAVIDNRVDAKIHQWCGALVGGFEPYAVNPK
jgi:hypothetical protein